MDVESGGLAVAAHPDDGKQWNVASLSAPHLSGMEIKHPGHDRLTTTEIYLFPLPIDVIWARAGWRRGRVVLSDADIDSMEAQCQRRWTPRRPRTRG